MNAKNQFMSNMETKTLQYLAIRCIRTLAIPKKKKNKMELSIVLFN